MLPLNRAPARIETTAAAMSPYIQPVSEMKTFSVA